MCSPILVVNTLYVEQELGFLKFIVVFRGMALECELVSVTSLTLSDFTF